MYTQSYKNLYVVVVVVAGQTGMQSPMHSSPVGMQSPMRPGGPMMPGTPEGESSDYFYNIILQQTSLFG